MDLAPGVNEIIFTLNHEKEFEQSIDVLSPPTQIDPETTSHQEALVQHEILNAPTPSSNDLQKNLVTMPLGAGHYSSSARKGNRASSG